MINENILGTFFGCFFRYTYEINFLHFKWLIKYLMFKTEHLGMFRVLNLRYYKIQKYRLLYFFKVLLVINDYKMIQNK